MPCSALRFPSGDHSERTRLRLELYCHGGLTTLCTLTGADGTSLFGTLSLGNDGNLCGNTVNSSPGAGTLLRNIQTGTFKTIYRFDVTDGNGPWCGLVLGADGNSYGATTSGGTPGGGTVFMITPDGVLTNLHNFSRGRLCSTSPAGARCRRDFYESTTIGGAYSDDILFKITPDGAFTTLHTFASTGDANPWGASPLPNEPDSTLRVLHPDYATLANSLHERPCDSATPACMTNPLKVFNPAEIAGLRLHACSSPRFANSRT